MALNDRGDGSRSQTAFDVVYQLQAMSLDGFSKMQYSVVLNLIFHYKSLFRLQEHFYAIQNHTF